MDVVLAEVAAAELAVAQAEVQGTRQDRGAGGATSGLPWWAGAAGAPACEWVEGTDLAHGGYVAVAPPSAAGLAPGKAYSYCSEQGVLRWPRNGLDPSLFAPRRPSSVTRGTPSAADAPASRDPGAPGPGHGPGGGSKPEQCSVC